MKDKIFNGEEPTFRTAADLKTLHKFLSQRIEKISPDTENEYLNTSKIGTWFYNQARAYLYDIDAMNESEVYDKVYNIEDPLPEDVLTKAQQEAIDKYPINVEFTKEELIIEVLTKMNKKEYSSLRMTHNIAREVEAKLNLIKNKEGSLYGRINKKYKLEIIRYVQVGSSSRRVCDPSNIEVSNLINVVCRKLGLSDAYDSMIEFKVSNVEIEKRCEEKTIFFFKN